MVAFLFWNLNRLPRQNQVAALSQEHDVDVVILAECAVPGPDMQNALSQLTTSRFQATWSATNKVAVFTRLAPGSADEVFCHSGGRWTVRRLILGGRDILLAAAHFYSKMDMTEASQIVEAVNLSSAIKQVERDHGHQRTILVGDLNMNPFDKGVIMAGGLNGVTTRKIAARTPRRIAGIVYPYFYNPMWGFFGDRTSGPPGTYYYLKSEHDAHLWNIYDQVLLRSKLVSALTELRILDRVGATSLLTVNDLPNQAVGSDHLPLLFRLDLSKEI